MTKEELELGMIVKLKNGEMHIVFKDYSMDDFFLMGEIRSLDLDAYDPNTLKHMSTPSYDIVAIYDALDHKISFNEVINLDENTLDELWKRGCIDWSKVPVDTKILVRDGLEDEWRKRYFAEYKNNKVYAFVDSCTSWITDRTTKWKYAKLADEN